MSGPIHLPPRISRTEVAALFPDSGPVFAMIFGEAPGPVGADQSHIPFWGDGAGVPMYRALERAGRAEIPAEAWENWNGRTLRAMQLRPTLKGVALSNAFPFCPTDDGNSFRAPRRTELFSEENLERIRQELGRALERLEAGPLGVIALGHVARSLLGTLTDGDRFRLTALPHPSSNGLLQSAPNHGKGMKLAELRSAWEERLVSALHGA